jgi:hypothetical protein
MFQVTGLYIYPIKAWAGVEVPDWPKWRGSHFRNEFFPVSRRPEQFESEISFGWRRKKCSMTDA